MKVVFPVKIKCAMLAVVGACLIANISNAQTSEPHHDQLLNGLRILLWTRPGDQNVTVKLRIHSGAAFDTAGRAGTMALLGDILFPDAATHDYFTQEMGGLLQVDTDYDAINITLQGRANEYDRIVDILRGGVATPPLTPENVAKVRYARLSKLGEAKASADLLADQAIAERVLGSFPYTRPSQGTNESLSRIDRGDLLLARDRFLSPNNATIAIIGGVDQRRAMRALRQLLGGWRKSEQIVPASFRQPDPADVRTLIVNSSAPELAQIRVAARGLARSDPDFVAASMLSVVARERWQKVAPELAGEKLFVRVDAKALPGMFVMGTAANPSAAAKVVEAAKAVLNSLVDTPVSAAELQTARSAVASGERSLETPEGLTNAWLDLDTYGLPAISDQRRSASALSAADLQRTAKRLFRDAPIASVAVGNSDQLKTELAKTLKIELMSDRVTAQTASEKAAADADRLKKKPAPVLLPKKETNPFLKKPVEKPD